MVVLSGAMRANDNMIDKFDAIDTNEDGFVSRNEWFGKGTHEAENGPGKIIDASFVEDDASMDEGVEVEEGATTYKCCSCKSGIRRMTTCGKGGCTTYRGSC